MKNHKITLDEITSLQGRICGIDEAGRGCIAGSMFVCGVLCDKSEIACIDNVKDSKQLTRQKRDEIFKQCLALKIPYLVLKFEACEIDSFGIAQCLQNALLAIKMRFGDTTYIFDGSVNFGVDGVRTLVKGDSLVPQISLAGIIAKSLKDKECDELHQMYPQYNLSKHKGYGTKEHIERIRQYGLSEVHRRSFRIKELA